MDLIYVLSHFSPIGFFATLWTVARQASLSAEFSREEYWSGLHFLLQGIFPTQGSNPCLMSPGLAAGFFTTNTTWEARSYLQMSKIRLRHMSMRQGQDSKPLLNYSPVLRPGNNFKTMIFQKIHSIFQEAVFY